MAVMPQWMSSLTEEDLLLIKRMVLHSGSLKALAEIYGVSYPTMRQKLNRLIDRIEASEKQESAFVRCIKDLTLSEAIEAKTARQLLELHEQELRSAQE